MNEQIIALNELKKQNIEVQKRGIHFLLTAVIIFTMMPISYGISRILHIDFQNKGNPFSSLGLFSAYLL